MLTIIKDEGKQNNIQKTMERMLQVESYGLAHGNIIIINLECPKPNQMRKALTELHLAGILELLSTQKLPDID